VFLNDYEIEYRSPSFPTLDPDIDLRTDYTHFINHKPIDNSVEVPLFEINVLSNWSSEVFEEQVEQPPSSDGQSKQIYKSWDSHSVKW